jgi:hypothetical protein
MHNRKLLLAVLLASLHASAQAVDGVTLIDQAKALAGNLTPGDAPGFPVVISRSGSYRLSGNLTVANTDTTAVLITAPNVTLDLNGFAIAGPVTCTLTLGPTCTGQSASEDDGIGIDIAAGLGWAGIAVRNGQIRGLGGLGLRAGDDSWGMRVDDLSLINNGRGGMVVNGAVVSRTLVMANDGPAVQGHSVLLTESQASNNNGHGLSAMGARGGNFFQSNHGAGANANVTPGSVNTTPNVCGSIACP